MTVLNHITLDAMARLPIAEIVALPASELARLQQEAEDALRKAKLALAWLDGALLQKYGERARTARAETGKDFGVVRFVDGEITVLADLPKKIEWDQHELAELVERIKAEGEDPRDYVEVSLKVAERKYAAWPNHIAKLFEPARSVRPARQTFQLIAGKEGF
jgi:hypothetical protein